MQGDGYYWGVIRLRCCLSLGCRPPSRAMYSEDWQALGDVQFRKWECYQLDWDINVDDHQVVGAPYGGPLAVLRDERKMVSSCMLD